MSKQKVEKYNTGKAVMNKSIKVLIAYDGSASANAILDDLWLAGLPRKVEAVVISVAEMWLPIPAGYVEIEGEILESFPPNIGIIQQFTSRVCESIKSDFPDWKVRSEIYLGSPAKEILEKAEKWKPDLIVLGSRGQSAISRFVFGSVAQKVVTEAKTSVRVSRDRQSGNNYPLRLIIGTDGSDGANAAVETVASRNWPTGSQLRLVTSVDSLPIVKSGFNYVAIRNGLKSLHKTRAALGYVRYVQMNIKDGFEAKLRSAGLTVTYIVKEGDPRQTIIEEAEKWGADTIFMGSRGLGQFKRLLLGSVSTAVVARAPCSVEIVHRG
jgi:nucleotide-binding universal stress UspA family protein